MTRPVYNPTAVRHPGGDPVYRPISESSGMSVPSDHGLLAWSYDPILAFGSQGLVSGTPSFARVYLREPATITKVWCYLSVLGNGLVSAQNFLALVDAAGGRVGVTADQTSAWGSTGLKSADLVTPYQADAGAYWVELLSNATTSTPSFARPAAPFTGVANVNLTASASRFAAGPAGQTTPPGSITPANLTASSSGIFWVAVS